VVDTDGHFCHVQVHTQLDLVVLQTGTL